MGQGPVLPSALTLNRISACCETVHKMPVQCTEVVHIYVPKWSYRSGPHHEPQWSCTELVLPPPPHEGPQGPIFQSRELCASIAH